MRRRKVPQRREKAKHVARPTNKLATDSANKEPTIFQAIWWLLKNKSDTKGEITANMFALIISFFFRVIAIALVFLALIVFGTFVFFIATASWSIENLLNTVAGILLLFSIIFVLLVSFVIIWGMANEAEREKDKNFLISLFTSIITFAALIVAIISTVRSRT